MKSYDIQTVLNRRAIRSAANSDSNTPIEFVAGNQAPRQAGSSWHYETKGGAIISHPSAYSKRGWSNMVYVHSTRRVIVGAEWGMTRESVALAGWLRRENAAVTSILKVAA